MQGTRAATIGLLVLVVLVLSSCGDDGERTAGPVDRRNAWVRVDDQPVVVAPNPSLVTGFDAGVAVLNLEWALDPSAPDLTAVAVLAEDGSWFSLPTPAPVSGAQISRAGDTLVLIGASGGDLVVQTLAPGAEQWTSRVADVGRVSDDSDWSITGGSESQRWPPPRSAFSSSVPTATQSLSMRRHSSAAPPSASSTISCSASAPPSPPRPPTGPTSLPGSRPRGQRSSRCCRWPIRRLVGATWSPLPDRSMPPGTWDVALMVRCSSLATSSTTGPTSG